MNDIGNSEDIKGCFDAVEKFTKDNAPLLYSVAKFLPLNKRDAIYLVSVLFVDKKGLAYTEHLPPQRRLINLQEAIESVYGTARLDNRILLLLREAVNKFLIPKQYFSDLAEGIQMDLRHAHYHDFTELHRYCYKTTGAMSLILLKILGYRNSRAEQYAVNFGIAVALANILKDIKEDYKEGRIYLPIDEMERYGLSENHIREEKLSINFKEFMKFNIERARKYFINASDGISAVFSLRARFAICLLKELYLALLQMVERQGYDIFTKPINLSPAQKTLLILKVLFTEQYL